MLPGLSAIGGVQRTLAGSQPHRSIRNGGQVKQTGYILRIGDLSPYLALIVREEGALGGDQAQGPIGGTADCDEIIFSLDQASIPLPAVIVADEQSLIRSRIPG